MTRPRSHLPRSHRPRINRFHLLALLLLALLGSGCQAKAPVEKKQGAQQQPPPAPCALAINPQPRGNNQANGTDCNAGIAAQEALNNLGIQFCPQGTCAGACQPANLRCLPTANADLQGQNPVAVQCMARQVAPNVCANRILWSCNAAGDFVCECNCRP